MRYSATEAARIIAESGTAPEDWTAYVQKLRREAREDEQAKEGRDGDCGCTHRST